MTILRNVQVGRFKVGRIARMQMLLGILLLFLSACERAPIPLADPILRVESPAGWCAAKVYESVEGQNTQVILEFDGGRAGAGAVSFKGTGLNLAIRWLGADTLEVEHPAETKPERNASGEVIQFYERKVRVLLIARTKDKERPTAS